MKTTYQLVDRATGREYDATVTPAESEAMAAADGLSWWIIWELVVFDDGRTERHPHRVEGVGGPP